MPETIRLIDLLSLLIHWIANHFLRIAFLQTISYVFLVFIFICNKIFCSKNWGVIYIFLIWFGVAFIVTATAGMMLGIAIKTILQETSTNTYFWKYEIHYIAKTQGMRYAL